MPAKLLKKSTPSGVKPKTRRISLLYGTLRFTGIPVLFNAWSTSSGIVGHALALDDDDERGNALGRWQTWKMSELQYIAVTSALVAAVTAGSLSWNNAQAAAVGILSCWYSGLLMAIIAVTVAMQQFNILSKFKCLPNEQEMVQRMLHTISENKTATRRECLLQHYIWQTPMMLLNFSIVLYVLGLLQLVFTHPLISIDDNRSDGKVVIVVFGGACVFSIGTYLLSWMGVYLKIRKIRKIKPNISSV